MTLSPDCGSLFGSGVALNRRGDLSSGGREECYSLTAQAYLLDVFLGVEILQEMAGQQVHPRLTCSPDDTADSDVTCEGPLSAVRLLQRLSMLCGSLKVQNVACGVAQIHTTARTQSDINHRAVRPDRERHEAERSLSEPSIWRCRFEHLSQRLGQTAAEQCSVCVWFWCRDHTRLELLD